MLAKGLLVLGCGMLFSPVIRFSFLFGCMGHAYTIFCSCSPCLCTTCKMCLLFSISCKFSVNVVAFCANRGTNTPQYLRPSGFSPCVVTPQIKTLVDGYLNLFSDLWGKGAFPVQCRHSQCEEAD